MKQKTLYIIGGSIVGLSLSYFTFKIIKAYRNKKLATENEINVDTTQTGGVVGSGQQSSQGAKPSNDSFNLKLGSYGYKVTLLQSASNELGASIDVDGKYGQKTQSAITEFGGLPFYKWNKSCDWLGGCSISQSNYNEILSNATQEGWSESEAKALASKDWKEFSGNVTTFSNLTI